MEIFIEYVVLFHTVISVFASFLLIGESPSPFLRFTRVHLWIALTMV